MARKILTGSLIALSSILLVLSIAGIVAVWIVKAPLAQKATSQIQAVDNDLKGAQSAIQNAKLELERTLRLVDAAETSLTSLKDDFSQVKALLDSTNGMLEDQVLPGLNASRGKIDDAKTTLKDLQGSLAKINSLPYLDLNIPGEVLLGELIASADSLDTQIGRVEDSIQAASTFTSDASYLMGGDFTETKTSLQNFLSMVTEYDQKLTDGRAKLAGLLESLPGWITAAAILLTVFLLWFGFSQLSLILFGLNLWQGSDPLEILRKTLNR